jgi:CDP-4-dehydro-6-deoxyglucose reductase, E1
MISKKDCQFLEKLINKSNKLTTLKSKKYPLLEKGFTTEDILKGIEVLLSRKLTMSEITKKFENSFSKFVGSKYALMVNSGSSANLLSAFALINPKKKSRLKPGDKFIIPAICWSTSLWPLVQCGLQPEFIDVNINNYCLDENLLKKNSKAKAIMNIHILGNSADMIKLTNFAKQKKMYLIEDTCEALGSKFKNKFLGTFGDFGTYSFYYSHQITSGEGGMIVCKTKEDYELIHTLRSHGWDRGLLSNKKKNNFNFVNSGFNLRPMDLTAAIGLSQLKRLNGMINSRSKNRKLIIDKIINHNKWKNQFDFFNPNKDLKPSWFGMPLLINSSLVDKKEKFVKYLNSSGIETRPILSGNFLNQESCKLYKFKFKKKNFKKSQEIEDRGFFIGLPTNDMSNETLNFLCERLLKINDF